MHNPASANPRLPAPTPTGWYGSASIRVSRFLLRLQGLPAGAWLAATEAMTPRRRPADPVHVPLMEELADHAARRRLHAALETMPGVVDRVRRRVDGLLGVFEGMVPTTHLARMRRAARLAALAIAAQPLLRPEDVARLCRPFRELVPIA